MVYDHTKTPLLRTDRERGSVFFVVLRTIEAGPEMAIAELMHLKTGKTCDGGEMV